MKSQNVAENPSGQSRKPLGKSASPTQTVGEQKELSVNVSFYSYFKDLTGCADTVQRLAEGSTLGDLFEQLAHKFPKLAAMRKSTLMAVGVDYQNRDYVLQADDEISLFPPVQGG